VPEAGKGTLEPLGTPDVDVEGGTDRAVDALTTRSLRLIVEHDQDTPPWTNAGKHTSNDSPFKVALNNHALKWEKPLKGSVLGDASLPLPNMVSYRAGCVRRAAFANSIRREPRV
jgi:hypothetical protein